MTTDNSCAPSPSVGGRICDCREVGCPRLSDPLCRIARYQWTRTTAGDRLGRSSSNRFHRRRWRHPLFGACHEGPEKAIRRGRTERAETPIPRTHATRARGAAVRGQRSPDKQAASGLSISEATLQIHRRNVIQKIATASLADQMLKAERLGIPITHSRRAGEH